MKNLIFFLIALTLLSSCTDDNQTEHSPHLEALSHTIYTNHLELFVEFKPFVVGQPSRFAAHFTVLGSQFTALSEAEITVSLITNGKGIRQSVDSCSSPGIFRLALSPKIKGTGSLIFDVKTKNFTDRITIPNVTIYENEAKAMLAQTTDSGENDISYLKEQAWKVEFANASIKKKTFENVIKTSGEIQSAQGDERIIVAQASGIVLFTNTNIIEGAEIGKGQNVFTISGGNLTEDNLDVKYKAVKSNFNKAKQDFERASELITDQLITLKEFQALKQQYELASNQYNSMARNYSSNGENCIAPLSGFIKQVLVKEGQYVTAGTPLASVSKNKKLILQALVSQKYFNQLATVRSAHFKNSDGVVHDTEELNGVVLSYGRSVSTNSPLLPISFEIDNIGNLMPGSVVEVFLKSHTIPDALVVPITALIEEQGVFYIYVQTSGERFQKRAVELGANDGLEVQILNGLKEGERVVTKGAYQIKLAEASGVLPAHGHEH